MSAKRTLTIALASLAAGAVLGLLLAPASGKESRKKTHYRRSGVSRVP